MTILADLLPFIAVLLVTATSIGLLLSRNWRWLIAILAFQYAGVAILTATSWPILMSIVKMVSGWMAGTVLSMAAASVPTGLGSDERYWPTGRIFRVLAALMVLITVLSATPMVAEMFPQLPTEALTGGLILISMGLLQLGMTAHPLRISIGLLTLLGGFEIIYAALEVSTLVAGLLAGVNVGLGVIGAYMITVVDLELESE